ncbi:Sphingomyelin phosphodiesterase 2 [Actinoplanes sp. SE50]|uniref:endonuclease/exonuclease/phosphatase family protein n=1 Tax=unclassified Actinoplanes TaxID=2626549 RepID=UPI00023EC6A9|nr:MULTISPECIES: endonuclease/exonuclease/phosphatase family protein [unclassified Actinoplanes]AEV86450.1 Sphingomyelin phosphodiesterase 2 [Actinoplanes sp. SE50/110]ATO84848.1 Sphingomyelin phosphodiesterase 2 [Actinoplanes sp. SE50]SLM02257.1 Sphingomyelin phosphodiesterase 2 [Actinoplanes sp. SE50/110]
MRQMTVVSLNLCVGLRNSLPPLRERAAAIGEQLEDSGAQAVLLQEVWTRRALRDIRARLPSYRNWVCKSGLAIGGREPLSEPRFRRFAGVPAGHRSQLVRAAAGRWFRGLLTARTADGALLGNTQLTSNRDGDWSTGNRHDALQRGQLRSLHAAMRAAGDAPLRILGGDFNVAADSPLYSAVTDGDTWTDPFAGDPRATFRIECLPAGSTAHRIDYLLVSGDGWHVAARELLFTGDLLSDHCAPLVRVTC